MALIEARELTRVYKMGGTDLLALRGVNLTVEAGERLAIIGTSGSGKSTLMNVLGCLDRPTSGAYVLAGVDVAHLDRPALAVVRNETIGFVFQSFHLLARTSATENVELPLLYAGLGAAERRKRAEEALDRVGLGDRRHHHPNQLSGGQQQRVAIARAIVNRPKLLLADEPTGALDSTTSDEVMDLLAELGRDGMTVVLVTHDPDIAAHAPRVITMKDGTIRWDVRRDAAEGGLTSGQASSS